VGVLMIARNILTCLGLATSLSVALAAPAFAERAPNSRHSHASLQRRAFNARSVRLDRYRYLRRLRESSSDAPVDSGLRASDIAASVVDEGRTANDPPSDEQALESGVASWYGSWHQGHITSSGRPFDQNELTAAHPWLPLGSRIRVTLVGSDRSVEVTITDRLGNTHRIIDLSREAARVLGMLHRGTARVILTQF
jgi:rare lipoprotein A